MDDRGAERIVLIVSVPSNFIVHIHVLEGLI